MDVYHVYCERNPPQKTIDTKVPPYVKIAHTAITPHCLNCLHSLHCLHSSMYMPTYIAAWLYSFLGFGEKKERVVCGLSGYPLDCSASTLLAQPCSCMEDFAIL